MQAVRNNAARSQMCVSEIVTQLAKHALDDQCSLSGLVDPQEALDAKLDVRLSSELLSRLRHECNRLRINVSVYIRIVLFGYYTRKLIFVQAGERYTLVANHDQNKSA